MISRTFNGRHSNLPAIRPGSPPFRRALGERLRAGPLFDAARFRRALEAAYRVMCERCRRGDAPVEHQPVTRRRPVACDASGLGGRGEQGVCRQAVSCDGRQVQWMTQRCQSADGSRRLREIDRPSRRSRPFPAISDGFAPPCRMLAASGTRASAGNNQRRRFPCPGGAGCWPGRPSNGGATTSSDLLAEAAQLIFGQ